MGKVVAYFRQFLDLYLIATSSYFDKNWYLEVNTDVANAGNNPFVHYLRIGGFEGRDPGPEFDSDWYLDTYKDVKDAGINPLVHYLRVGRKEGRKGRAAQSVSIVSSSDEEKQSSKEQTRRTKTKSQRKCDFFFIVGTGRSGTTLTAQVLNAHSKIAVPSELQLIFEHSNNGERLAEAFASKKNLSFQAKDYIRLVQTRCPHDLLAYYDYRAFFFEQEYPILSLQSLLTELYTDIAYSQGKSIFAEQTPWYGQNIPLITKLFPQAKFVHMVRDGRDVAISFARTPWWDKDVNLNLERWEKELNKTEKDAPKERLLTIRYEDLVSTPEEKIREICHFLDVPFEKRMLDPRFHIDYSQFGHNADSKVKFSSSFMEWKKEKKSAFFTGSVYGWKTNNEVEFRKPSLAVQQTLERFGYDEF